MPYLPEPTEANEDGVLSVALIGPDDSRRAEVSEALAKHPDVRTHEFLSYPADLGELPRMMERDHDVFIVDLDSDPKLALEIVETICGDSSRTVMVYSADTNRKLVVEAMRAGAREFLVLPLSASEMAEALQRASIRRPGARPKNAVGSLFVFLGAKGGCGVTTLATNFALSLAQESGEKVLLIDLGLPLGDVAIHLGIAAEYSTENAFHDIDRLDSNLLFSLVAKHISGLYVLPAPGEFPVTVATLEVIDKLMTVARRSFDYVVVDAGSRTDLMDSALFDVLGTIFLVIQIGVSELRNGNRLISQFFANRSRNLQIVINRHTNRIRLFDEEHVDKALTRSAQWKIPEDSVSARRTRNTATALAGDSPISVAIRKMARKACGLPEVEQQEKKKALGFFTRAR
jgi:pilus assembly protein CpaE